MFGGGGGGHLRVLGGMKSSVDDEREEIEGYIYMEFLF